LLTIGYVFNFIDRQILAILLPAIKLEFGVDDWVLGFLVSAFALFYVTLGIPIALLADRWNRRNLIAASLAIWSAMTALSGMAANTLQLALARFGVGIGEAGFSPAAHSIISDLYPPERRTAAMGVFTLGISIGIMLAYLAGGWVAQNIGWRVAFFIVGIPGVLLALLFWGSVKEPRRGQTDIKKDCGESFAVIDAVRFLWRRKSFVHMSLGAGLSSFNSYAGLSFFPSFLVRSHSMELQEVGLYLGIIIGFGSSIAYVGGGYLADRIGAQNRQQSFRLVGTASLIAWVLSIPIYFLGNPYLVLTFFFFPIVLSNAYLPTTFSQTQGLVSLRMRSVASALLLFVINFIGLGLGPQVAGILSDLLATTFAAESLRFSLLAINAITLPWAAWHFFIAGRHINSDLRRSVETA